MDSVLAKILEPLILVLTPVGLVLLGGSVGLIIGLRTLWDRLKITEEQHRLDMETQRKVHQLYVEYIGRNTEVLQQLRQTMDHEAAQRAQLNDRIINLLQDLSGRRRA